jgi:hypothetical protein
MDAKLSSIRNAFDPSRYSPGLGHSWLKLVILGKPTERFFVLHQPTLYIEWAFQIIRENDGWDAGLPRVENLLYKEGA